MEDPLQHSRRLPRPLPATSDHSSIRRAPISVDQDPSVSTAVLYILSRKKGIVTCSASGCPVTVNLDIGASSIIRDKWETVQFACSLKHLRLLLPNLHLTTMIFEAKIGSVRIMEDSDRIATTLSSNRIALLCSLHSHSPRKIMNLLQGAILLENDKFSCVTCVLDNRERASLGLTKDR
ncbi:hypothetical protein BCR39DRAFT_346296 [Naematelia encephala]|uniref:Uncharacterized protein n=1 Tax=Naematelia encephala TaxID=71784 RepID=A0A1Y2AM05_9TREE|nr:hypothetical protein BCR39DRAFT_346296 [Naematelia encephala]